ncbi:MAG: putative porin [Candidatus Omnitrophota bacterium]
MNSKRKFYLVVSFLLAVFVVPGLCFAGEIDILVAKLVEKGILTQDEAEEIVTETKKELKEETAKDESDIIPKWVQNIKMKGDLRTRYQWETLKGSGENERVRVRLRLGMDAKVNEKANAHVQLATGSRNDLRSTNQTLGGNSNEAFGHYDIWLDQAYMNYAAMPWLTMMAGKMPLKEVFWETGDMLFDTDINPDGTTVKFDKPLNDNIGLFADAGWWVLQDGGAGSADVTMVYLQPGIGVNLNEKTKLKTAVGYMQYNNLKGKDLDVTVSSKSSDTNSTDAGGGLKYDFNSWVVNAELGIDEPFSFLPAIPYISLFGDYVNNPDPDSGNTGYLVGCKFGAKKVKEGQWQGKYMYRHVGEDAVLDIFPDSDCLGGATDVKSHELVWEYGLGKSLIFELDYCLSERIKASEDNYSKEHLLQADVVYSF